MKKREITAQQATTQLLALVGQTPTEETLCEIIDILTKHETNQHIATAAQAVVKFARQR